MDEALKQRLKDHINTLGPKDVIGIKYKDCGLCADDKECQETMVKTCQKKIRKYFKEESRFERM